MKIETVLTRARNDGILFAEDFDSEGLGEAILTASKIPQPIEPAYDATDIAAARAEGWEAGRIAARQELQAEDEARLRQAIEALAPALEAASAAAREAADDAAGAIARLLLTTLGTVLPTLCEAHGEAEAVAVARAVLPGLTAEPVITIRANPLTLPALGREIERMDPDLSVRVRQLPTDALLPGDVRFSWQDGHVARDTTELWNDIVAVLLSDGLIQPNQASGASRNGG